MRILMVCLGNICRSPMAEGIMKHKVKQLGLDWEVDSAGTSSWHNGEGPDPRTMMTAARHGINLKGIISRLFVPGDFARFNRIYVMDRSNYHDVMAYASTESDRNKVIMMLGSRDVPDPYYDDDGFEKVFNMLDDACERIITREMAAKQ